MSGRKRTLDLLVYGRRGKGITIVEVFNFFTVVTPSSCVHYVSTKNKDRDWTGNKFFCLLPLNVNKTSSNRSLSAVTSRSRSLQDVVIIPLFSPYRIHP